MDWNSSQMENGRDRTWLSMTHQRVTALPTCSDILFFHLNRIRYLLLARMLRLIRLLMYVNRYRAFIATFLTLIPSLMPYLGIIFCILCIYCSLGEQVSLPIQFLNLECCPRNLFLYPDVSTSLTPLLQLLVKIFGGIVNAGNSKLNTTALYDDGYPFSRPRLESSDL